MRTANRRALVIGLLGLSMLVSACVRNSATVGDGSAGLSDDEKHRLYAAALAASDTPLDSDVFKKVCRKINIYDDTGKPNDKYMGFISDHVKWTMNLETESFKQKIDTRQKAEDYIRNQLSH